MSKAVVYILDKAVWLLLATVLTGQALQITGFMETPKSAGSFEYQQNSVESLPEPRNDALRWKRDTDDTTERSQFIDMLFNSRKKPWNGWLKSIQNSMSFLSQITKIPIKTLTAVNNLIQNSRPALRKLRDFAVKRFEKTTKAPPTDLSTVQKRSPVFIREVGSK